MSALILTETPGRRSRRRSWRAATDCAGEGERRFVADAHQRVPVGLVLFAYVHAIRKDAERRVDALRPGRGIRQHLPVLPDEDLLVVPSEADADVLLHVDAVRLLGEDVGAHRLHRVHDLREAIVVVGCFDLQGVEVAVRLRRP